MNRAEIVWIIEEGYRDSLTMAGRVPWAVLSHGRVGSRAHELRTPVLVVWGKYDRFISVKLAYEIAEKLPNAKLEVIDKSGHYVHMDSPQGRVQVATRFLGEMA